ncbi:MAG: hypothetical protein NT001_02495 [Candidatus Woesearchaeota archaeon]|nr:hypothetical protein [Candidatus Woesearchaeota archaeon]
MDKREQILIENFNEYFTLGSDALKKEKYNSAATLFFKALVSLCDLLVFRKEGIIPSSHANRFRILEQKHPKIYKILDRDFPFYQDSYTKKIDKETAELFMDDAEHIKKTIGI